MGLVYIFAEIKIDMKSSTFIKKKHLVKQVRSVDPSTGEIFEDNTEQTFEVGSFYYYRGVKNGIFEIFDFLSGNDFRVLLFLFNEVKGDKNIIQIGNDELDLMDELEFRGSAYECFRKSISKLIKLRAIKRVRLNTYMISPYLCFSGSMKEYKACVSSWENFELDRMEKVEIMFAEDKEDYERLIDDKI
jgi:hypothetical protein